MEKTYTITEITNVRPNAYQGSTGIDFKVDDEEFAGKRISVLTKYPDKFTQGSQQTGSIVAKEKDGKTYYNFNFAKGGTRSGGGISSEQYERLMVKLDTILTEVKMIRGGAKVAQPISQQEPIEERNPREQEDPLDEEFTEDQIPF